MTAASAPGAAHPLPDTLMTQPVNIQPDETVNSVVQRYPEVLPILARAGIDTCCGGGLPIGKAAQAHGLTIEVLLEQLRTVTGAA